MDGKVQQIPSQGESFIPNFSRIEYNDFYSKF